MVDSITSHAPAEPSAPVSRARILVGCCVGSFFNISSVIFYSFGVFAIGIASELRISNLEATRLIGPAILITIIAWPIVGWIVDRWPRRNVALAALALLAAGVGLISLAPPTPLAITLFLAVAIILSCVATPTVYNAYLSEVFDKRRGLAMGVSTAFTGLGIAIIPLAGAALVTMLGWRTAYGAVAGSILVALLANFLLFPVARPTSAPRHTRGSLDVMRHVFRTPLFWAIALLYLLLPIAANAVPIYLPLILSQRGASHELAATSLTLLGLAMIVSRPLLGFLIDKWATWIVLALLLLGPILGAAALILSPGIPAAFIAAVGFGIGIGGEFVSLGYIVSRTYGVQNFGTVYGWLSVAVASGVAAGPLLVGALSSDNDFGPALYAIIGVSVVGIGLTLVFRHYQRPDPSAT